MVIVTCLFNSKLYYKTPEPVQKTVFCKFEPESYSRTDKKLNIEYLLLLPAEPSF